MVIYFNINFKIRIEIDNIKIFYDEYIWYKVDIVDRGYINFVDVVKFFVIFKCSFFLFLGFDYLLIFI